MLVTGIGQCSLDLLALVDSYPSVDTKKEVLQWDEQGGGPVATALVALARLGVSCRFHGVVGDDDAGKKIEDSLRSEGVDVAGLVKRKDATSQVAFIAVEKGTARRTIFWKRPSGEPLTVGELGRDFLEGSRFLLLDGLMGDVSLFAAGRARALTIPVMIDAGRMRPGMVELARLCDYVVASEEFAADLQWEIAEEALARERERIGAKVLTITLGERGSITVSENAAFHVPAFKVEAIDTTGAGDVFHGGYIHGVLRGLSLKDSVTFASALAALKCTKMGGRKGIPRLDEVSSFLVHQGRAGESGGT